MPKVYRCYTCGERFHSHKLEDIQKNHIHPPNNFNANISEDFS